ncbi:MAG TPA: hypothetical protein VFK42_14220 [Acidimicrobiales bacterium]|nr:hypothetical protein [Acidimicrobiales bacterium]
MTNHTTGRPRGEGSASGEPQPSGKERSDAERGHQHSVLTRYDVLTFLSTRTTT